MHGCYRAVGSPNCILNACTRKGFAHTHFLRCPLNDSEFPFGKPGRTKMLRPSLRFPGAGGILPRACPLPPGRVGASSPRASSPWQWAGERLPGACAQHPEITAEGEKKSHFSKCEILQALSIKDGRCPDQERARWRRQRCVCCSKATVANAKDHSKAVFYYLRSL